MNLISTPIKDLFILEPRVFGDDRGFFFESFNQQGFNEALGRDVLFVQDNHSKSAGGVLRGLHYQLQPYAQGKLVRVVQGSVLDVALDLRLDSPSLGQHFCVELSAENKRQFWIPPGFAHGFLTLSESAEFLYKTTNYYAPSHERCIAWNDPALGIDWQLGALQPALSGKDQAGLTLEAAIKELKEQA